MELFSAAGSSVTVRSLFASTGNIRTAPPPLGAVRGFAHRSQGLGTSTAPAFYFEAFNNSPASTPLWGAVADKAQIYFVGGSAAAPGLAFLSDVDTGLYSAGTNILGVSTAGVVRFQFAAAGQLGIGGATYGTAGQALLSGGASAAPAWTTLGANPSAAFGVNLTGANGAATTYLRSDAVLKLDLAINPTWTAAHNFATVGFNGTGAIAKPTVSGSRADPEAALANLLTALANYGLITNSTTA
jgi:hypothetical protein